MKLEELKDKIEEIEITYDYEDTYNNLYNIIIDYSNETQDYDFEYLFEDIINYDLAEELAKQQLEDSGLIRLYYFLGDVNLNHDIFRINGYGNLEDIYKEDLEYLKDEILNIINNKLEEEL